MIRLGAAGLLVLSLALPAQAQDVAQYLALARAYATGDGLDAEQRLAQWSRADIVAAEKSAAVTGTTRDLMAAAMLHTELANRIIDTQSDTADFHVTRAEWLLGVARGDSSQTERLDNHGARLFTIRWLRFVAGMYTSCNRLSDAARFARLGLLASPRDPRFYVALGTLMEVQTLTFIPEVQRLAAIRGRLTEEIEDGLKRAAKSFLQATAVDAHNAEAQLHLGRVRFVLADKRAKANFDAALADAPGDRVRYLAHLFLGGIAEREQRLADAQREYDAARRVGAAFQTPLVALSHIEDALGHAEQARDLALVALQLEKRDDDPWWDLRIGFDRDSLDWLRAEARKP